jgi:hypothetical protein
VKQRPEEDANDEPLQQFAKLRISTKDKAVYYGPNSRFAFVSDYPEIFKTKTKNKMVCREVLKSMDDLLADEQLSTGFPFTRFDMRRIKSLYYPIEIFAISFLQDISLAAILYSKSWRVASIGNNIQFYGLSHLPHQLHSSQLPFS